MSEDDRPYFAEQAFKRSLNRKIHKLVTKRLRLDRINNIVKYQFFNDNNNTIDTEESSTPCYQSSDCETYDISFQESQVEQNNVPDIELRLSLSGNEIDNTDLISDTANINDSNSVLGSVLSSVSSTVSLQVQKDSVSYFESSSSDDEQEFNFTNNEKGEYVKIVLKEWACEPGILSKRKLDDLLAKLHPIFPNLPLSYKTLLETPSINLMPVNGGDLWYKGITYNLNSMNLQEYLTRYQEIVIDVNINGLPLHKSSSVRFWPILGRLIRTKNEPFIIAIFKGRVDPNVNDFLEPFVQEINNLFQNGYLHNNIVYKFFIRHYILDAPARAKVKCCIEHGGYCGCEKCEVVGEWIDNRMTYVELDKTLRTDESFRNQKQLYHHQGYSPLLNVALLISQFRLDALHLIDLGVFKRFLLALWKWNGPWKLHRNSIADMSNKLVTLKDSCPSDFNRLPRSFEDFSFMKGTEYRRLLLYDGVVIFRNSFHKNIYKLFLLLHTGIYILRSPVFVKTHCQYANELLRTFIKYSAKVFGSKFVVYNVYSMCHLSKECEEHGALDDFSAYPFENKLFSIKKSLQSSYKPLKQAAYRDLEKKHVKIIFEDHENEVQLRHSTFVRDEIIDGLHYKSIIVNDTGFKCNMKDSCFKTIYNDIVILHNIIVKDGTVFFIGYSFIKNGNAYEYPLSSSELGIVQVSDLSNERRVFYLTEVVAKCWLIPDGENFICFPLLHTLPLLK
ncbi:uncharacterized protein [Cardiocondyla obscurior]|uniref:uncharacterized protein n=1 Tax=Cardiocondyla obscurior TaxID=286306 RepID=UPI0039657ED0